jgi:hypothetical protein
MLLNLPHKIRAPVCLACRLVAHGFPMSRLDLEHNSIVPCLSIIALSLETIGRTHSLLCLISPRSISVIIKDCSMIPLLARMNLNFRSEYFLFKHCKLSAVWGWLIASMNSLLQDRSFCETFIYIRELIYKVLTHLCSSRAYASYIL